MNRNAKKIFNVALSNYQSVYVIAKSHTEAIEKVEKKINVDQIINSIHNKLIEDPLEQNLRIKSVTQLCDEIIS